MFWEEIKFIETKQTALGGVAMWTFFSKTDFSGIGIGRSRLKRGKIYCVYSDNLRVIVMKYSGRDIISDKKLK
ncbi:MAG: hypothetical protein FWE36_07550 [Erysipelotrichales bacterium]|nr:hypothetical protein [Erysipelotrichales bacterium]